MKGKSYPQSAAELARAKASGRAYLERRIAIDNANSGRPRPTPIRATALLDQTPRAVYARIQTAADTYFTRRPKPLRPEDLTAHACINIRLPTYGGLYVWEFEKARRELKVRVEGQLVFDNIALRVNAALAGFGLAYLPEDQVQAHLADRRLIRVLADWCPPFSGYHLYYPSRRQLTPAFVLLVDALRFRGAPQT